MAFEQPPNRDKAAATLERIVGMADAPVR
jgi:hypothetical protein